MRRRMPGQGTLVGWMVFFLLLPNLAAAGSDLQLVDAVQDGDHAGVRSLLRDEADVNARQAFGATVLAWAANRNDLEMVKVLIEAGADVNLADVYGVTPLSLACTNGNAATVKQLLTAGANPNVAQVTGETPLMTCTRTGNVEAVKALLVLGADASARESERGQTALMWAAAQKHPRVVQALVEHGADLDARSATRPLYTPTIINKSTGFLYEFYNKNVYFPKVKGGFTPLMFAAQSGDVDSLGILLAAGADINSGTPDDGTALVLASVNGQEQAALFLLEKGADPNLTDGYGLTPLHWALQEGLVALFARPSSTDRFWDHPNMPELVRSLLTRGAAPNAQVTRDFMPYDIHRFGRNRVLSLPQVGLTGATPFLLAAAVGDVDAMRTLLEEGADPTLATEEGTTPVMVAAGMGTDHPSRMNQEQKNNLLEAVRLAVKEGNDVNAVTVGSRTALHGAALYGLADVVQFLAEQGADLDARDIYGQTAISIALADPDGRVYRHLKDYNNDARFRRRRGGPHQPTVDLLLELGVAPYTPTGRNIKVF